MGIRAKGVKYIKEIFSVLNLKDFKGLRLLELGDLALRNSAYAIVGRSYHKVSDWFRDIGFEVVVIDSGVGRGEISPGVFRYNLSELIVKDIGKFDFIIDFGTGEHVNNQYWLHRNIHHLCKPSGVILRCNPSSEYDMKEHRHGVVFYTVPFYRELSRLCGYKIIDIRKTPPDYWMEKSHCVFVSLFKSKESDFPSLSVFNNLAAIELGSTEGEMVIGENYGTN